MNEIVTFRVTAENKILLKKLATEHGVSKSELLNFAVSQLKPQAKIQKLRIGKNSDICKSIKISLTRDELELLQQMQQNKFRSINKLCKTIIFSELYDHMFYSDKELELLQSALNELNSVGRNLNNLLKKIAKEKIFTRDTIVEMNLVHEQLQKKINTINEVVLDVLEKNKIVVG